MHRINFGAIRKTVTDAVSSAAHGARDLALEAKEAVERALVAKCLRSYVVREQIASSGPKGLWKIYAADYKSTSGFYPFVSVWILEKKFVQESNKMTRSKNYDAFLEQQKTGAGLLLKLKHPGILKIIEPLEETRTQYIMVTEPIFCSLSDWLSYFNLVPDVREDVRDVVFSELEIKHGLLQVTSGLQFLHTDASLVHCSLSPDSIVLCADGRWVLWNFGLSTQIDFTGNKAMSSFNYDHSDSLDQIIVCPNLQYTAPEMVTTHGHLTVNMSPAVDVFSLALVTYSCLTRVSLISCGDDVTEYKRQTAFMSTLDLSALPATIKPLVQSMLSSSPTSRPSIGAFSESPYFIDDLLLRAIQFLEGMVGRDSSHKASFLKDLDKFWTQLDVRIIRNKVLPPLLQELQNPALQGLIIPFIFKAAGNQSKSEFENHTSPKLMPILKSMKGEALLIVMTHCEHLIKVMNKDSISEILLPLFLNSLDSQNPKIQDEALRKLNGILDGLDFSQLKSEILPRVHGLSMKTVNAKIRINSLVLMGTLIPRLGKEDAEKMIQTCTQIASVDRSPGTLMCILGVGDSISKHWGYEITVEKVIPMLSPLLTAPKITHQQFSTFLVMIRDMLNRVEEKRGKQLKQIQVPIESEKTKVKNQDSSSWDTTRRSSMPSTGTEWDVSSLQTNTLNGIQAFGLDTTPINIQGSLTTTKSADEDLFGSMLSAPAPVPVPTPVATPVPVPVLVPQMQPQSIGDDFFQQPLFTAFPVATKPSTVSSDPFANLMNSIPTTKPQKPTDPFVDLLN